MKRAARLLTAALWSALISVHVLAFMQARALTRFAAGGGRSARPEQLGLVDKLAVLATGVRIPRPQNRRTPKDFQLDFETRRFASPSGAMLEAWFIPGAEARPLIALFHGYGASKSSLLSAAEALHHLGYGTLLVDFYGSGGSSGSGTASGVKAADDVAAAVESARSARVPALILHGGADTRARPEEARRIAAALGENARLVFSPVCRTGRSSRRGPTHGAARWRAFSTNCDSRRGVSPHRECCRVCRAPGSSL